MNPLHRITYQLLHLPRIAKRVLVLAIDSSLCVLTVWLSFYLRLGEWISLSDHMNWLPAAAVWVSLVLAIPIFIISGFYRAIFRYSGWSALATIIKAIFAYALIYAAIFTAYGIAGVPRTVGIIQPILLLLTIVASRSFARYWLGDLYRGQLDRSQTSRLLIYGAGVAGRQLAAALSGNQEMRVCGFLDDDTRLTGQVLNGVIIYHPDTLADLVDSLRVSDVLLALPSVSRRRRNEILQKIRLAKVSVRTLPSVTELAQGKVTTNDLRDLDIDDLLGREPVAPDTALLSHSLINKVILITGAGGSIGSELCRQIAYVGPSTLLLVEQSEFALYAIHQELLLRIDTTQVKIIPLLASIQDGPRMKEIIHTWQPHTIFHAAAYKHVPLVEHNPAEGIKNNVFGTRTIAQIAQAEGVANFVLVSTDKAVRPTNIMGATKRLAEMVLQAISNDPIQKTNVDRDEANKIKTLFCMVRFGNVLGSSGSVVPLFKKQLQAGGPITLTHPDITRYFMSIPEAAQLVLHAAAMSRGGDLFVLNMGDPVKIMDLAHRVIELSGLTVRNESNPDGDIEIAITGLRPAEKLYEELLIGQNITATQHPKIMMAQEDFLDWQSLSQALNELEQVLANNNIKEAKQLLQKIVSGYTPSAEIVDWVTIEQAV